MIQKINKQLEFVSKSIDWVHTNLTGERQDEVYRTLVNARRHLNKIKVSLSSNPAAVLYGASQCGKSHLASALLSNANQPLVVLDGHQKSYHFLSDLNPGGNGEATGLITRFTTDSVIRYNDYPVCLKLMSIKDILLVICEGYYHDVANREPLSVQDINSQLHQLEHTSECRLQNAIKEDDIWDIEEYFKKYMSTDMYSYLSDSRYFERAAVIVEKISIDDWVSLFSLLWNSEPNYTRLFSDIIGQYRKVNFASEVYMHMDELFNQVNAQTGAGSLLSVAWLDLLNDSQYQVDVVYDKPDGTQTNTRMSKAYLAALGAEVVLQLPQDLNNQPEYSFLKQVDFLDFPGARSREGAQVVTENDMPKLLRRGKVAYYFNKYAENFMINTLLFCWQPDNFEAKPMGRILQSWIKNNIGETPEKRELFINKSEVAPLFFVGTKFNMLLKKLPNDRPGKALSERWDKWFISHLHDEIVTANNDWFDNWTTSNQSFNNIYLLRDFQYSGEVYEGWAQNGQEGSVIQPHDYPNLMTDLEKSFCEHTFVKSHFDNPQLFWDESALANHDGSQLILRQFKKSAIKIKEARDTKFEEDIAAIQASVLEKMGKLHRDEGSDNALADAKRLAGETQAALDIAYGHDAYFFGKMMQKLVLKEGDVYTLFHDELQKDDPIRNKELGQYVYIRMKAASLSPENDFDTNLSILARAYEMDVETCKSFFENRGIDLLDLFSGSDDGMKNISLTLAELLEHYWFETWLKGQNYKTLSQMVDSTTLDNILDMLRALYTKIDLTQKVAQSIRQYVDKFGVNIDVIQEMIADMCAEMLNKFVTSVGYAYYTEDSIQSLKDANAKQNLGLSFLYGEASETISPTYIANMFEAMDDLEAIKNDMNCERLKFVPGFVSRKEWSELLKIGFIQTKDIPNYDVEANNALGQILNMCNK